jgi:hypothetical protein
MGKCHESMSLFNVETASKVLKGTSQRFRFLSVFFCAQEGDECNLKVITTTESHLFAVATFYTKAFSKLQPQHLP